MITVFLGLGVALGAAYVLWLLSSHVLRSHLGWIEVLVLVYFVTLHLRMNDGRAASGFGAVQALKLVIWSAPLLLLVVRGPGGRRLASSLPRGAEAAFALFLLLAFLLGFLSGPLPQNLLGVVWLAAGYVAARWLVLRHGLAVFTGFVAAALCTTMLINGLYEVGIELAGFGAPPQLRSLLGVPRMIGLGVHANLVGRNGALLVLIAVHSPLFRRWPLQARLPMVGLGAVVLAWSGSRSSLIALVGTLLVVAVVRSARSRSLAFTGVGAVLLIGAVSNVGLADLQSTYGRTGKADEITTLTGRTDVWTVAARSVAERPLDGHGFAGSIDGLRVEVETETGLPWATHAHNWALQTAYTTGVLGLALMAIAAVAVLVPLFRPGSEAAFIGAIGAFTLIIGVSESPLGLLQTFLPAIVWMGCLVATARRAAPSAAGIARPLAGARNR